MTRLPLIVCRLKFSFRVCKFRHLLTIVVLNCSIASFKVDVLLLLEMSLTLFLSNPRVVVCWHRQPWMIEHCLRRGPLIRVPVQNGQQEFGEGDCLAFTELVLLLENFSERPEIKAANMAQLAR